MNLRRWLFSYWRKIWPGSLLLGFISVAFVGFQLLEPWPLKILIDSVFGTTPLPSLLSGFKNTHQLIMLVAISVIVIYGAETLLAFIKSHLINRLGLKLDYLMSSDYFERVEHLSLASFDDNQSSDYVYRQNSEIGAVSGLLIDIPDEFFISGLIIFGIAVVMMKINLELSLIGFVIIPLLYISIRLFSKRIEKQAEAVEVSNSKLYGYTTESIENLKLIQSFNKERSRLQGLQSILRINIRLKLHYSITDEGFTFTNDMLATGAMALLVILGSSKVLSGHLTVGDLLIFLTYLADLYLPLQTVSETIGASKVNLASSKRVFEIFKRQDMVREIQDPIHIQRAQGHIQYQDVTFYYKNTPVLHHINLDILPGQRVAFIGHSGSGKSTLLSLLPRFYDYREGRILLDGIEITQLKLEDLRQQFAIVTQDSAILSTSIANNLAFARPSGIPSEKELLAATKAANAYEFINRLPETFNTRLIEGGTNLSGGQLQRLAVARAFLKDAPILLLDEPTSALDADSEAKVSAALSGLMINKTTLIVSHNGGMLNNVDTIYVIERGRITDKIDRHDTERFERLLQSMKSAA